VIRSDVQKALSIFDDKLQVFVKVNLLRFIRRMSGSPFVVPPLDIFCDPTANLLVDLAATALTGRIGKRGILPNAYRKRCHPESPG
jgi:hypothetical protein